MHIKGTLPKKYRKTVKLKKAKARTQANANGPHTKSKKF
jgi:hypothetical protein